MRSFLRLALLAALLLAPLAAAQLMDEPGEARARYLFERGLGGPWIISEKHPEMYGKAPLNPPTGWGYFFFGPSPRFMSNYWTWSTQETVRQEAVFRFTNRDLTLLGFVGVGSGNLSLKDTDYYQPLATVKVRQPAGSYPVYGIVESGALKALYVDLKQVTIV
ncbi:MAG: hypothetical protein GKC10_00390 [Methanosarcinales archaeon]|nr:hypothetical protein [Methanosarcinales archaeon]